jgi:hypothetical protein
MSGDGYGTIAAGPERLIDLGPFRRRLALLIPALLLITSVYIVTRWCLGNTLALHAQDFTSAQWASRLAPADPQSHFTLAVLYEKSLLPEDVTTAVQEYEHAVSLSPHDYRLWQALGRARERAGLTSQAENAFLHAISLSGSHANPRWLFGNFLLRQGRTDEAFSHLRIAGQSLPSLKPQVLSLAWSVYDGDLTSVTRALGDKVSTRVLLIDQLVRLKRFDDALALWAELGPGEKRYFADTGNGLLQSLLGAKRFSDAMHVWQDISPTGESTPTIAEMTNKGFEQDITLPNRNFFGWTIEEGNQPAITVDTVRYNGGARSLLLTFNSRTGAELRDVSQFVLVEKGTRYRLEFYVRTEDLKSLSTLVVEVLDADEGTNKLASTTAVPPGTNDWSQVTLEFATPRTTNMITVRIVSAPCPSSVCPIFGKIWYDDFNIRRVG